MRLAPPDGFLLGPVISQSGASLVFEVTRNNGKYVCKRLAPRTVHEPAAIAAFARELRILEALAGRGAPRVGRGGEDEDGPFIVMERVNMPPLGPGASESVVSATLHTLTRVHEAVDDTGPLEIVHGDLSPSNVLAEKDRACLVDFGFARFRDDANVHSASFYGTVRYTAPEQARGETFGQSADVFSLALSLLHALSGIAPRDAPSDVAMLTLAAETPMDDYLERISGLVSAPIRARLAPCLAFDPASRPRAREAVP